VTTTGDNPLAVKACPQEGGGEFGLVSRKMALLQAPCRAHTIPGSLADDLLLRFRLLKISAVLATHAACTADQ